MALTSRAVSVTTTATRLDDDTETDAYPSQSILIYNNGSVTIYLGGSDVTSVLGVPVPAGTWGPGISLAHGEELYAIAASSTADCRVLETGV